MNPLKINDTTYEVTLPRGDRVEIGDREAPEFRPRLKLNRWDGESFIKVGLPTTAQSSPVIEGEKVGWVEPDIEARFYPLEPVTAGGFTQNELGGFEFEIVLKKKPPTNQIVLDIETQGLKYHYQPPLTPEEIAEGAVRPDNVVGSYAVYHDSRGNMHASAQDAEKYKCGKAFHIYRPKIIDADGDEVWAELNIDEKAGTLTITIDQDWLNKAVYPVAVDPTFGYTSIGGSLWPNVPGNTRLNGTRGTGAAGTADSISMYGKNSGDNIKGVLVKYSDKTIVTNGVGNPATLGASAGWVTSTFATPPTISAQDYFACYIADAVHGLYYDSDSGVNCIYDNSNSYSSPTDPTDAYTGSVFYSLYCTYTGGGGATEKQSSDSGTGADARASGNPAAAVNGSETGSGADSLPGRDIALPDSGAGVDALVSLQTPAAKTSSDNGSGVEGTPLSSAALAGSETGIGVDALVWLQMPAAKTSSDTGSGVEGMPVSGAVLAGVESGIGVEAFIARLLAAVETGYSAEASIVGGDGELRELLASELGEGADGLTAKIEVPTKGGGMRLWT